jgi:hypothetical protein
LKQLMVLEILSVAMANYFISSPEVFRPNAVQVGHTKQLLRLVHSNLHHAVELIASKVS